MDIESLRLYCLKKEFTDEAFPFDENTLVLRVFGKMFVLTDIAEHPLRINLKCDPEEVIELQEKYDSVLPGYHMNKKYWITVILDNSISDKELYSWIDNSYNQVLMKVAKKDKDKFLQNIK
ncbi:MAG: MmcQ/YjbR family DNA-binding protein [Bacteroidota bacterium]